MKRGGKTFDDEHLDLLSHVLDDLVSDSGDVDTVWAGWNCRVHPGDGRCDWGDCVVHHYCGGVGAGRAVITVLARMVANVAIEVVVGSVPVMGDLFDIAWRANRRNYALLTGCKLRAAQGYSAELAFSGALCAFLMALVIVPTLLVAWLLMHLMSGVPGVPR